MARRRFRPTTEKFDERLIVRAQEAFDYGTVSDVAPEDLPHNAVAKLVNARGHKNALKIIPTKSLSATYTTGNLYSPEGLWTPDDTGTTYYADTGDVLFIKEFIDAENVTVGASAELSDQTFTTGDIVPRINAQYYDSLNNMRYFLIGSKVYARSARVEEWIEYFILGDQPTNTTSQMFKLQDKIILTNANGVYVLNSVYDGRYGWKTNDFLPEFKLDLRSPEVNATRPSAYNYLYTYTRLNGCYEEDRNSVNTYTEVETPPILVDSDIVSTENYNPEIGNTDFTTMTVNEPIDTTKKQLFEVRNPIFNSYTEWVDMTENNLNPSLTVTIGAESAPIYCDFGNVESMDDVAQVIQRGLKDYSSNFWVLRRMIYSDFFMEEVNTFVIYNTDVSVEWSIEAVDRLPDSVDLLHASILNKVVGHDENMGVVIGKFRYPSNRKDITHYSAYRTKDIYPYTQTPIDLTDPRIGASSNIFGWVADIPVVDTVEGVVAFNVTDSVYELTLSEDVGNYLIGSTYTLDEASPTTRIVIEKQDATLPNKFVVSIINGVLEDYPSQAMFTGTDTVFTASKIGNDIVFDGYVPVEEDIGKPIFWTDGTVSYLTSLTTTLDDNDKSSQRAYISPTERNWYDTMSDNLRDGYAYYNTLKTRFYDKLPQSNLAAYNKGLLVLALKDYNKLYYSDTSDLTTIGYNHTNQVNDSIEKGIRCLFTVKDVFTIMTTRTTHTINPKQSTVIETDFGEFYSVMPDAFLVNGSIGASGQFRWALGEKGDVMIITNEPAVRFFDGTSFTANLADGKIQNTELKLLNENMLTSYSSIGGIHIWGFRSELWQE